MLEYVNVRTLMLRYNVLERYNTLILKYVRQNYVQKYL